MRTKRFIAKTPPLPFAHGKFNGYVAVPPEHPLWGKTYNDEQFPALDVHGGVSYTESCTYGKRTSTTKCEITPCLVGGVNLLLKDGEMLDGCIPGDWWIIGFDTCHLNDTPEEWDRQAVIDETTNLQKQLEKLWK